MKEKTHWLGSPNKNYLGHWDLPWGEDLILTIKSAGWEEVKDPITGRSESKKVIRFEEDYKPLICNQTNAQSIIKSTGERFMEDSVGKKIQLFLSSILDRRIKENVDCIRIRRDVVKIKLPELNPTHEKWHGAKEAIKTGHYTIVDIKKKYSISLENERKLCLK